MLCLNVYPNSLQSKSNFQSPKLEVNHQRKSMLTLWYSAGRVINEDWPMLTQVPSLTHTHHSAYNVEIQPAYTHNVYMYTHCEKGNLSIYPWPHWFCMHGCCWANINGHPCTASVLACKAATSRQSRRRYAYAMCRMTNMYVKNISRILEINPSYEWKTLPINENQ